jgi:hypothetical protein
MVQVTWGRTRLTAFYVYSEGMGKFLMNILKLITVDDAVKTVFFVYGNDHFSYDTERYASNDQAYDNFFCRND